MTVSLLNNLQTFASFCGQTAMPNVVIATTMWDKVDDREGKEGDHKLKTDLRNDRVTNECKIERFENTYESAWHIIGSVARKEWVLSEIDDNGPVPGIFSTEAASKQLEWEAFMGRLGRIFSL
jgi:hypothetical protein